MHIALIDAATNCAREGATATISLKSGLQFSGKLERPGNGSPTAHMKLDDGGWATIDIEEIAAVESRR